MFHLVLIKPWMYGASLADIIILCRLLVGTVVAVVLRDRRRHTHLVLINNIKMPIFGQYESV